MNDDHICPMTSPCDPISIEPNATHMAANVTSAKRQGVKPAATLANMVCARSDGVAFHIIEIGKNS
ncbi:hypothetical protein [Noviherbaspirillum sp.]|jgi:hypothetical protein|uniref:hypothetical protein n=1 Tax=Noviherbaspirillum sp. TaxID=1926288 RepID=UPI0025D7C522|nr:hypothetical protein [Noviherbaspirillum sp.]